MTSPQFTEADIQAAEDRVRLLRLKLQTAKLSQIERNKFSTYFLEDGPFRRLYYPKHMEFFAAGARFKERLFMAANRVGKSESGAYEVTCHATGKYPNWWVGRRFERPVEVWACGTTSETTRDIVQEKLLGKPGKFGTGMIPGDLIEDTTTRRNALADSVETIKVRHKSGGTSFIGMKSYQQGRESFEGTGKHLIWCDEEPPADCYTEMLYRTATTKGITLITFTPLQGRSDVVNGFLEPENESAGLYKFFIQAGWDDIPHLSEEEKKALLATTPPHLIEARTKGEPSMGAGAIYPIADTDITCDPFEIPDFWPRSFAMDVGWKRTAALWGATDPGNGRMYIYDEHYQGQGEPASHAQAIKARGEWIRGVIDPAARGRSQADGRKLIETYREMGLNLIPAMNAVDAGLSAVWQAFVGGRIKIFRNCQNTLSEKKKYHRDENGNIVKESDHLMDCFTGDTEVMTVDGPKPIQELVGTTGKVVSRDGSLATYTSARKFRHNSEIVRMSFSDGSSVKCTPDHRFLTPNGWKKAVDMAGEQCYNGVSQRNYVSRWKYKLFLRPFRNFADFATICAESISSAMGRDYIGLYGRLRTAGECRTDGMYITLTTTEATTGSGTSNLKRVPSTQATTRRDTSVWFRCARWIPLLSGTGQKQESNGIGSISKITGADLSGRPNSSVSFAHGDSPQLTTATTDSARITANQPIVAHLASTMKNVFAWGVGKLIWSIATRWSRSARESAVLRCVSVKPEGFSDTYCLTVPGSRSFCLANGAVVHNCLRYLWMTGRNVMTIKPQQAEEEKVFHVVHRGGYNNGGWAA